MAKGEEPAVVAVADAEARGLVLVGRALSRAARAAPVTPERLGELPGVHTAPPSTTITSISAGKRCPRAARFHQIARKRASSPGLIGRCRSCETGKSRLVSKLSPLPVATFSEEGSPPPGGPLRLSGGRPMGRLWLAGVAPRHGVARRDQGRVVFVELDRHEGHAPGR